MSLILNRERKRAVARIDGHTHFLRRLRRFRPRSRTRRPRREFFYPQERLEFEAWLETMRNHSEVGPA